MEKKRLELYKESYQPLTSFLKKLYAEKISKVRIRGGAALSTPRAPSLAPLATRGCLTSSPPLLSFSLSLSLSLSSPLSLFSQVVVSPRVETTPCILVTSQYGNSANMERIMRSQAFSDPGRCGGAEVERGGRRLFTPRTAHGTRRQAFSLSCRPKRPLFSSLLSRALSLSLSPSPPL